MNHWHFLWRSSTLAILRRAHQKLFLDVKGTCLEAFTNVALQTNKKTHRICRESGYSVFGWFFQHLLSATIKMEENEVRRRWVENGRLIYHLKSGAAGKGNCISPPLCIRVINSAIHKFLGWFFKIIELEPYISQPTKFYQPTFIHTPNFVCLSSTVYEL